MRGGEPSPGSGKGLAGIRPCPTPHLRHCAQAKRSNGCHLEAPFDHPGVSGFACQALRATPPRPRWGLRYREDASNKENRARNRPGGHHIHHNLTISSHPVAHPPRQARATDGVHQPPRSWQARTKSQPGEVCPGHVMACKTSRYLGVRPATAAAGRSRNASQEKKKKRKKKGPSGGAQRTRSSPRIFHSPKTESVRGWNPPAQIPLASSGARSQTATGASLSASTAPSTPWHPQTTTHSPLKSLGSFSAHLAARPRRWWCRSRHDETSFAC